MQTGNQAMTPSAEAQIHIAIVMALCGCLIANLKNRGINRSTRAITGSRNSYIIHRGLWGLACTAFDAWLLGCLVAWLLDGLRRSLEAQQRSARFLLR